VDVFFALSDPTRRQMVRQMADGPVTATELSRQLPISRQAISKHLAALDQAGLVKRQVEGREVRYTLNADGLENVTSWVSEVGDAWDERLARLKKVSSRKS
jgi:DNA-binding transcriptional ArsR family regulator